METQYIRRLEEIEAVIDNWLPQTPDAGWFERVFTFGTTPVAPEFAAPLIQPGWDLVKRGGKRWRPLLMTLVAEAIAGESGREAALPLTPLVEFPHNASLIHDDIEDNSDERRGKPAVHLIYGVDTAINAGAFMYFLPLACLDVWAKKYCLNGENYGLKDKIWTIWASHMRALHLGQAMDISWHRDFFSLPALDDYDRMCRLKTGCLARLAAVLGVYCAGSGLQEETLQKLTGVFGRAAEELGVGFQILDDVKNLDTGIPGKKRGDDIVEGKKSLPVLLYLHRYPEKRDFAVRCFSAARVNGVKTPEVEEIIGVLKESGVLEEARKKGLEYIRKSGQVFSAPLTAGIPLKEEGRMLLAGFIDLLL